EGLDEACHGHGVDVGVAGLVRRDGGEFVRCLRIGQRRMVHPERGRREEPEHVEPRGSVPGVDEAYSAGTVEIEDEVETVGEHVPAEDAVYPVGGEVLGTVRVSECSAHDPTVRDNQRGKPGITATLTA